MQLSCPNCGREIDADDVHLESQIAKCRDCNAVFSFAHIMVRDERRRDAATPGAPEPVAPSRPLGRDREPVPPSKGIQIREAGGVWEARTSWFSGGAQVVALLLGLLNVCMCSGYAGPGDTVMLWGVLHGGVFLVSGWCVAALFVNSTRVQVASDLLVIESGPLWTPAPRLRLRGGEVSQLFCRPKRGVKGERTKFYELVALLKTGKVVSLMWKAEVRDLLFYEQEIERRMWIQDRAIPGEEWY